MPSLSTFILSLSIFALPLLAPMAFGLDLTIKDCTRNEKANIQDAMKWIKSNMSKIDKKMGKNGLMDWPGNSRKKFVQKLDKPLKIYCINHRNKCQNAKKDGSILRGRVVPIMHQRKITLCANNLYSDAAYASVLAHEIGHLVRLNAHRTNCKKKYQRPRFSQSVGLATYHAYLGTTYRSSNYTTYCP